MSIKQLLEKQKNTFDNFTHTIDETEIEKIGDIIASIKTTLIIYGIGKSENIAIHMASIFNSINIKSIALKAQNCLHGDLGFIQKQDYVIFISNSGNTKELLDIAPYIRTKTQNIIGFFSNQNGKLIEYCNNYIILPKVEELSSITHIPTSSVLSYISFINVLLSYVIEKNKITNDVFNENHPNGNIGKLVTQQVKDIMIPLKDVSIITRRTTIKDCLFDICKNHVRCSLLINENGLLDGIITDGDLRRYLSNDENKTNNLVINCINKEPKFVYENDKLETLLMLVKEDSRILSGIPVLNECDKVIGLVTQKQIIEFIEFI